MAQIAAILYLFLRLFGKWQWIKPDMPAIESIGDCMLAVLLYSVGHYWPYVIPGAIFYILMVLLLDGMLLYFHQYKTSYQTRVWGAIISLYSVVLLDTVIRS